MGSSRSSRKQECSFYLASVLAACLGDPCMEAWGRSMTQLFSRGRKSRNIVLSASNMESWELSILVKLNEPRRQKDAKKE